MQDKTKAQTRDNKTQNNKKTGLMGIIPITAPNKKSQQQDAKQVSNSREDDGYEADRIIVQICEAARAGKRRAIISLLEQSICIGIRNQKNDNASSILSQELHEPGIALLLSLGACINDVASGAAQGGHKDYAEELRIEHQASVGWIAHGAAQGGHKDYAEELRIKHQASVGWIARGAAIGGHKDYAEELRIKHQASVDWIASGAARGGHKDYAEELRIEHQASVGWIASGAAQGGHKDYAEELRIKHQASVNRIARGAARGGHKDYAEELRIKHPASVGWIVHGAALGGHKDYAEELRIKHPASVGWIAIGAAQGGHKDYAEELRIKHPASVNRIASGAAQGGHKDYAEELRIKHHASVGWIARGAALGGHKDYAEELRIKHQASVNRIASGAALGGHKDYAVTLVSQYQAKLDAILLKKIFNNEDSILALLISTNDEARRREWIQAITQTHPQFNAEQLLALACQISNDAKLHRLREAVKAQQHDEVIRQLNHGAVITPLINYYLLQDGYLSALLEHVVQGPHPQALYVLLAQHQLVAHLWQHDRARLLSALNLNTNFWVSSTKDQAAIARTKRHLSDITADAKIVKAREERAQAQQHYILDREILRTFYETLYIHLSATIDAARLRDTQMITAPKDSGFITFIRQLTGRYQAKLPVKTPTLAHAMGPNIPHKEVAEGVARELTGQLEAYLHCLNLKGAHQLALWAMLKILTEFEVAPSQHLSERVAYQMLIQAVLKAEIDEEVIAGYCHTLKIKLTAGGLPPQIEKLDGTYWYFQDIFTQKIQVEVLKHSLLQPDANLDEFKVGEPSDQALDTAIATSEVLQNHLEDLERALEHTEKRDTQLLLTFQRHHVQMENKLEAIDKTVANLVARSEYLDAKEQTDKALKKQEDTQIVQAEILTMQQDNLDEIIETLDVLQIALGKTVDETSLTELSNQVNQLQQGRSDDTQNLLKLSENLSSYIEAQQKKDAIQDQVGSLQQNKLMQSAQHIEKLARFVNKQQKKIGELEIALIPLRHEYNCQQRRFERISQLKAYPQHYAFYLKVKTKLEVWLAACKLMHSGRFKRENTLNFAEQTIISGIKAVGLIIPATEILGKLAEKAVTYYKERQLQSQEEKVSEFGSVTQLETLAEEVAIALTVRYFQQLQHIPSTQDGSGSLASCAIEYMARYISQDLPDILEGPLVSALAFAPSTTSARLGTGIHLLGYRRIDTITADEALLDANNWTDAGIYKRSGIKIHYQGKTYYFASRINRSLNKKEKLREFCARIKSFFKQGKQLLTEDVLKEFVKKNKMIILQRIQDAVEIEIDIDALKQADFEQAIASLKVTIEKDEINEEDTEEILESLAETLIEQQTQEKHSVSVRRTNTPKYGFRWGTVQEVKDAGFKFMSSSNELPDCPLVHEYFPLTKDDADLLKELVPKDIQAIIKAESSCSEQDTQPSVEEELKAVKVKNKKLEYLIRLTRQHAEQQRAEQREQMGQLVRQSKMITQEIKQLAAENQNLRTALQTQVNQNTQSSCQLASEASMVHGAIHGIIRTPSKGPPQEFRDYFSRREVDQKKLRNATRGLTFFESLQPPESQNNVTEVNSEDCNGPRQSS